MLSKSSMCSSLCAKFRFDACLQGVHMLFESMPDRLWRADEKRQSKMVFIGRDLDKDLIRGGFEECQVD